MSCPRRSAFAVTEGFLFLCLWLQLVWTDITERAFIIGGENYLIRSLITLLFHEYYSPGIDFRWCNWGFFSMVPPTEPRVLRSTQPLKVSTRDFSWGEGGLCVWLTTYHPCSAEKSRKSRVLTYPESLGPPRPVAGGLYFFANITRPSSERGWNEQDI